MTLYRFKHWEDPQLINPERTINVTSDMTLIAYYEEVDGVVRKGAPSESGIVTVTVHPQEAEATVLTLQTDKTEYNSGETITLTGNLKFQSDDAPLTGRTVDIYKNGVKITSAATDTSGSFSYRDTAEDVTQDTEYKYQAKFGGD